jgi:peptidoglycan/xylan/chitin deacetylase (PgdA/CDA1 family)
MLSKIGQQSGLALLLSAIVLTLPVPGLAQRASAPVILSFDTEVSADVEALRTLNIQEPATYFFTGEFARNHPDVVARLAEGNTIGSHSDVHADPVTLDKRSLRSDLLQSKRAIEEAAGRPVEWFRAPFLSYSDQVMEILHELGFRYDSSDKENWAQDHALLELPISADSEMLASDYNIFEQAKMSDAQALAWLKATYRKRAELGRPMVWLLHPKMIAKHAQVLHDFIQRVDGLLEHPLLVVDDDLGRPEVQQPLESVVAVDDPAVQVVEVGRREATTVELHHRAQVRGDHRDGVEHHAEG